MATPKSKHLLTEMVSNLPGVSASLPNLPEEIIIEILLRFPVKSLLKFRCVSKSWLALISTPRFIKNHLQISTKNNINFHNRLIFGPGPHPNSFQTFSLNPKIDENSSVDTLLFDYFSSDDQDDMIRIVGSCNGLVCVAIDPCIVVLWNPSTRKFKKLPCSESVWGSEYGFGYDEINDDYKVFQTCFTSNEYDLHVYETEVKVYSSKTDSWRIINWCGGKFYDGPGVFMNGSIHWKVNDNVNKKKWNVIAQNVTTESCSELELPMPVKHDAVMLGVCGGCLCASYDYSSYMDVWVMKEYGVKESWCKIVCFPYLFMKHHLHVRPKVLFVSENGGCLVNLGTDLIMYKPSQYHEVLSLENDLQVEVEYATYSDSLISPDFDHVLQAS